MTNRPPPGRLRRMLAGWSVRALLVLVALIAIVLGWIEGGVARQRSAARAVGRAGGQVVYDWQYPRGVGSPPGPPYVPRWLVDRVGEDHFGGVSAVSACFGRSDDAVAAEVGRLEGLRELNLTASAVTDAGLAPIAGLSRLTELSLTHTGVGDEGLAHLAGRTSLESLSLIGTRVTDAGLAHLENLDRLRWLSLVETRVGDEGLAHLAGLGGPEELWLGRPRSLRALRFRTRRGSTSGRRGSRSSTTVSSSTNSRLLGANPGGRGGVRGEVAGGRKEA